MLTSLRHAAPRRAAVSTRFSFEHDMIWSRLRCAKGFVVLGVALSAMLLLCCRCWRTAFCFLAVRFHITHAFTFMRVVSLASSRHVPVTRSPHHRALSVKRICGAQKPLSPTASQQRLRSVLLLMLEQCLYITKIMRFMGVGSPCCKCTRLSEQGSAACSHAAPLAAGTTLPPV